LTHGNKTIEFYGTTLAIDSGIRGKRKPEDKTMNKTTMAWSSEELVKMYNHYSCGHYFDKDTMRFFKSRVTGNFRRIDDNTALFITTEKGPCENSKRMATVRIAKLIPFTRTDGYKTVRIEINTIGVFNSLTLSRAKTVMKNYQV
jgi:hypothetical protein